MFIIVFTACSISLRYWISIVGYESEANHVFQAMSSKPYLCGTLIINIRANILLCFKTVYK